MKYSIMGFSQSKLLQFNLNLSEVLLLSYIYDAQASPTMSHIIEDGQVYTWLNHSKIQADLPILSVEERQLKRYIAHLGESGLIYSKQVTVSGARGSKAYYGITERCEGLRYDNAESEQGQKMSPNSSVLGVKNVPSDNLLNLDNKLDNTIPKGIVTEVTTEENDTENNSLNTLSEYESKMYSEDRRKIRKIDTEQPKKKKMSLWDKCVQIINEFTDDEKLRSVLTEFLKMRLSIKDKVMYAPQWKAMLERMALLKGDPVRIVSQSLEHGWAGFYDEKPNYSGGYKKKSVYEVTSEHANMNSNKVTQEEWEEMQKNGEVY